LCSAGHDLAGEILFLLVSPQAGLAAAIRICCVNHCDVPSIRWLRLCGVSVALVGFQKYFVRTHFCGDKEMFSDWASALFAEEFRCALLDTSGDELQVLMLN